jgi:hypothetical protein
LNPGKKNLTRLAGLVVLSAGLVLAPGLTTPASAAELVTQGGFEDATASPGQPLFSPSWDEADSAFTSPLCSSATCPAVNINPQAAPHSGSVFVWFGGFSLPQTASVAQVVTLPAGPAASLTFWYKDWTVTAPATRTVTVTMDATVLQIYNEVAVAETAYAQKTIDVSAFAGGTHTLTFAYSNPSSGDDNVNIDDVSITMDTTAPETTITSSPVGGVAKSLSVPISFSASESPSTFMCTVDSGTAVPCTSPRSLTVTPGSHTFKVAAKDAANNSDATPATVTFTAYDCPTLDAAVTAARAKADAAARSVGKAKKAVQKAKQSGNASKLKKASQKLKKAKGAAKAANRTLARAKAAAAPCASGAPMKAAPPNR